MRWYSALGRRPRKRVQPRKYVRSRKRCLHACVEMRRGLLGDHAEQAASLARLVIELSRDHMRPEVQVSGKYIKVYVYR